MRTRPLSAQDCSAVFHPHASYLPSAHVSSLEHYRELHAHSLSNPEIFWSDVAEQLHWFKPWDNVLDQSNAPFFKWYSGGLTNLCYNALDRHLETPIA